MNIVIPLHPPSTAGATTFWILHGVVLLTAMVAFSPAFGQMTPNWGVLVHKSVVVRQTSATAAQEEEVKLSVSVGYGYTTKILPFMTVELQSPAVTIKLERTSPYSNNHFEFKQTYKDIAEMERALPDGNYTLVADAEKMSVNISLDASIYRVRVSNFDALQRWNGQGFDVVFGPTFWSGSADLTITTKNVTNYHLGQAILASPGTTINVGNIIRHVQTSPGDVVTGQIGLSDGRYSKTEFPPLLVSTSRSLQLRFPISRPALAPTIVTQPVSQSVTAGAKVTLSVAASGDALCYQWQKDGTTLTGATNATLGFDSVQQGNAGIYAVVVSNTGGSVVSSNAQLTVAAALVAPSVETPPMSQSLVAGSGTTLTVSATGTLPISYQWFRDDTPITGATSNSLSFESARVTDSGSYTARITNAAGTRTTPPAQLTVTPVSRISNLSIRSTIASDGAPLTIGITIGGERTAGQKPLLLRAVGPTLALFGVADSLSDPRLALLSGANVFAENDDWAGNAQVARMAAAVGAFELVSNASKDAATVPAVGSGGYTVRISGVAGASGLALAEVYDATPAEAFLSSTPRLTNVSALADVGTGGDILIAGFAITGSAPKRVLVRGIGPALTAFGVGDVLADPKLDLFANGAASAMASNDNWDAAANATEVSAIATSVGAFPLAANSKDAVLLLTLPPGSYTAQVSGTDNLRGVALVEVYEVP